MKRILFILIFIIAIITLSCTQLEDATVPNGGIVMTFDDHHFTNWLQADSLLNKYDWKATFCVSLIGTRSDSDIARMQRLQDAGHEIAGHGYLHVYSALYTATHGIEKYLEDEITPMIELMEEDSIILRTFAYPYGNRSNFTDNVLFDYFDILRGTLNVMRDPEKQKCYFCNSRVIYAIGIDDLLRYFSDEYILNLLSYAHEEGKILIVYGHRPVDSALGECQVSFHTLDMICKFVHDNEMHFYTMSDLADFIDQ